jgi:hypothetical protein
VTDHQRNLYLARVGGALCNSSAAPPAAQALREIQDTQGRFCVRQICIDAWHRTAQQVLT